MNVHEEPLVSVITPVYNMGDFLAEAIESVLRQTYKNFEYIIVNNCSTDKTLDIALAYAKKDSRVQVHNNEKFVGVMENHNKALRLISRRSKYCKLVCADDWIFPDCLLQLVALAEANPSVAIVGSYQLSGNIIKWQGFEYPRSVFSGREICRRIFLCGDPSFGFGTPTSLLYRSDIVREGEEFYPNPSPHSDTSACFKYLQNSDFGFVYQVLSFERTHGQTQSSGSAKINRYISAYLNDVIEYGPLYLSESELAEKKKETVNGYYQFLAVNIYRFRDKEFWNYHKSRLEELGYPITFFRLMRAFISKSMVEFLNPEQAIRKIFKK